MLTQEGLWADDEVKYWLEIAADATPEEQGVQVIDPVWMTSVLLRNEYDGLVGVLEGLLRVSTVITAVAIRGHWYPLLWRIEGDQVRCYTGGSSAVPPEVDAANAFVARSRAGVVEAVVSYASPFRITNHCGAWAICFVKNMLIGTIMPQTMEELIDVSGRMQLLFVGDLDETPTRPWVWAEGDDKLVMLLKEHGVEDAEVQSRCQMLNDKLGATSVKKAMAASNPWRELKWLANQVTPAVQIIRPQELQTMVASRTQTGQVGTRSQKKQAKGKGKGVKRSAPTALDPSMLTVDSKVFATPDGKPVSQLDLSQITAGASGIVLTTVEKVTPYLQKGKAVSMGALAVVVLCVEQALPASPFVPVEVRFPVHCTGNDEPLLVTGFLFNLGAVEVTKAKNASQISVTSIDTCVAKLTLYRDQCTMEWDEVIDNPKKALIGMLPSLQVCDSAQCDGRCEMWHKTSDADLSDPVLEFWSRQWLNSQFQFVPSSKATIFSALVRLPFSLQTQVQMHSGSGGLYIEPRSLDGRMVSEAFQIIWLPGEEVAKLQMWRQTVQGVVGVARVGTKYGLRCRAADAKRVSEEVKPQMVYLPPGKKMTWLVGPFPYGTVRSSIVAALASAGWTARPTQVVSAGRDVPGMQSVEPPPEQTMRMQHGDIVVTRIDDEGPKVPAAMAVVGAARTKHMVNQTSSVDSLQLNDPWAKRPNHPTNVTPVSLGDGDAFSDLEQKVTQAVLKKVTEVQDTEMEGTTAVINERVTQLETKMQALAMNQQGLADTVQKHGAETQFQVQQLQTSFLAQQEQLETVIKANTAQFQEQYHQQAKQHETMLNSMFATQMEHFEKMLSDQKRQRTSGPGE